MMLVILLMVINIAMRWTINGYRIGVVLVVLIASIVTLTLLIRQLARIIRMRAEVAVLNVLSDGKSRSAKQITADIARGDLRVRSIYVRAGAVTDALAALTHDGRIKYRAGVYHSLNVEIVPGKSKPAKGIFLCYRRTDSADVVGRIYDSLAGEFDRASLFKDVDNIPPGEAFAEYIQNFLRKTEFVLVVIGRDWLAANEKGSKRLEEPDDYVRAEIETAILNNVSIIPVLVSGAPIPRKDDMPESIRMLSDLNAISVRPDPDYRRDIERLITHLKRECPSRIASLEGSGSGQT
jgi:hypothetical protein